MRMANCLYEEYFLFPYLSRDWSILLELQSMFSTLPTQAAILNVVWMFCFVIVIHKIASSLGQASVVLPLIDELYSCKWLEMWWLFNIWCLHHDQIPIKGDRFIIRVSLWLNWIVIRVLKSVLFRLDTCLDEY